MFTLGDVAARSAASARAAVAFIGAGRATHSLTGWRPQTSICCRCRTVRSPPRAHHRCAARPPREGDRSALQRRPGLQELAALGALGWRVASAHPALSFADPGARSGAILRLPVRARGRFRRPARCFGGVFTGIGARCFELAAEHKLLYHAGSVFASNFTTVLLDVALRAYRESGLDDATAMALLEPLVRNAIDNSLRLGPLQPSPDPRRAATPNWSPARPRRWHAGTASPPTPIGRFRRWRPASRHGASAETAVFQAPPTAGSPALP